MDDILSAYSLLQHSVSRICSIGFNVNVAIIIASNFTTTGQDIACVVESATVQMILEPASIEDISKQRWKGLWSDID